MDSNLGIKCRFEELEEEEEEEEEIKEDKEGEEERFSAYDIWCEQVIMTRKYLKENHRQMKAQEMDLPYSSTYRSLL